MPGAAPLAQKIQQKTVGMKPIDDKAEDSFFDPLS
jgi:hypothetical protein